MTGELASSFQQAETVWPAEWMLRPERRALNKSVARRRRDRRKDSVAAAVSLRVRPFSAFYYHRGLHRDRVGDWTSPFRAVDSSESLSRKSGSIRPLSSFHPSSGASFAAANFRSLAITDFIPLCSFHLYLTPCAFPLALDSEAAPSSRGNASHEGRIKMSQLGYADVYRGFFESFGLKLLMPLRGGPGNRAITDFSGWPGRRGEGSLSAF